MMTGVKDDLGGDEIPRGRTEMGLMFAITSHSEIIIRSKFRDPCVTADSSRSVMVRLSVPPKQFDGQQGS